jgi:hypothetical protein
MKIALLKSPHLFWEIEDLKLVINPWGPAKVPSA